MVSNFSLSAALTLYHNHGVCCTNFSKTSKTCCSVIHTLHWLGTRLHVCFLSLTKELWRADWYSLEALQAMNHIAAESLFVQSLYRSRDNRFDWGIFLSKKYSIDKISSNSDLILHLLHFYIWISWMWYYYVSLEASHQADLTHLTLIPH